MGSESSKAEAPIIINNHVPTKSSEKKLEMNSLNLSIEEVLKEIALATLIIFLWELVKYFIRKKAKNLANKNKSVANLTEIA
jgi:hypothetical protein